MLFFQDADLPGSVDRWAIRLDEPSAPPVFHTEAEPDGLHPVLFSMELPTLEFQPRLSRFDEAA